jgi:hypothetical protein
MVNKMNNTIKLNEWFEVELNEQFRCCDEWQDRIVCIEHGEEIGCVFCTGDYNKPCECED